VVRGTGELDAEWASHGGGSGFGRFDFGVGVGKKQDLTPSLTPSCTRGWRKP
jgi:hypothetical protein